MRYTCSGRGEIPRRGNVKIDGDRKENGVPFSSIKTEKYQIYRDEASATVSCESVKDCRGGGVFVLYRDIPIF